MSEKKAVLRTEDGTLALIDLDADPFASPPVVVWNQDIHAPYPLVLDTIQALQKWAEWWVIDPPEIHEVPGAPESLAEEIHTRYSQGERRRDDRHERYPSGPEPTSRT